MSKTSLPLTIWRAQRVLGLPIQRRIFQGAKRTSRSLSYDTSGPVMPPHWLSDTKRRVGECITFGLSKPQTDVAGSIMKEVAYAWRDLLAGSEGFLTGPERAGFEGREVAWGEMDVMVSFEELIFNQDLNPIVKQACLL